MKIPLQYDLVRAVDDSNRKIMLRYINSDSIPFVKYSLSSSLFVQILATNHISLSHCSIVVAMGHLFNMMINGLAEVVTIDSRQMAGLEKLHESSLKLNKEGIATTEALLRKTQYLGTTYDIRTCGNILPEIIEQKYIVVPTCHYGRILSEEMVQEHSLGKKEYVLMPASHSKDNNQRLKFS